MFNYIRLETDDEILKLRLIEGVCIEKVKEKFSVNLEEFFEKEIQKLLKLDLVKIEQVNALNYMKLTEKGMDFIGLPPFKSSFVHYNKEQA